DKIKILYGIIFGLKIIHQEQLVHRDLHSGNILCFDELPQKVMIADLGSSVPADQSSTSGKNNIYGVLPYIAPEVLNDKPYTIASDIYSFGILMSVISTGQQPLNDKAHNHDLMLKIYEGLRPGFS